ncbi:unnamed protein product [Gordionus sp. m RMFG-2023]|uniref:threonine synthase-like 2 n=1 Tax=Gordionus sp. m RMFG-2023 TaxID=3053472 RepID=UPI0030DFB90E
MRYISTRSLSRKEILNFEDILFTGYAKDGGLYIPEYIPKITQEDLKIWKGYSYLEISFEILKYYISEDEIPYDILKKLLRKAFSKFDIPEIIRMNYLNDGTNILELFHGPTYAFKDLSMSCIGQFMQYFLAKNNKRVIVLVGTSGDTGGAAIEAIKGLPNINLIVLLPDKLCTEIQELQMTTVLDPNIHIFKVEGTCDDLDVPIHKCFQDPSLTDNPNFTLCCINSINLVRVLVQIVHHVYAYIKVSSVDWCPYQNKKSQIMDIESDMYSSTYQHLDLAGLGSEDLSSASPNSPVTTFSTPQFNFEFSKKNDPLVMNIDKHSISNFEEDKERIDISGDQDNVGLRQKKEVKIDDKGGQSARKEAYRTQWKATGPSSENIVEIVVPSGAGGDAMGACLAIQMGIPLKITMAVNANDVIARTINRGDFSSQKPFQQTLSVSMDIQCPFNMERIFYIYSKRNADLTAKIMNDFEKYHNVSIPPDLLNEIQKDLRGYACDDEVVRRTILRCWKDDDYILCPHTAVGVAYYYDRKDEKALQYPVICISTASYVKFPESIVTIKNFIESQSHHKNENDGEEEKEIQRENKDKKEKVLESDQRFNLLQHMPTKIVKLKELPTKFQLLKKGDDWFEPLKAKILEISGE